MGIKYKVNKLFFKTWSSHMAYVLGFISADGCLEGASYFRGKYLRICSSDKEILEKIKQVMDSEHVIVTIRPKEICMYGRKYISKEKYYLRIGSYEIYNNLVELGITPNKSKTIVLPRIPVNYIKDFFRGYLDGDGCVNIYEKKKRLSVTFTSGSELFLKQLSEAISIAVGIKIHNVFSNKRAFQIKYSTKEAVPLLRYIYSDDKNSIYLERKYSKFLDFLTIHPKWGVIDGVVPKWLRELSAKQLCTGSNPVHASRKTLIAGVLEWQTNET
jgi:hypothetical protein